MNSSLLADLYGAYLDCLNRRAFDELGRHVDETVRHNGRPFGLTGYRAMLVKDFEDIPDLRFEIEHLVCEAPFVAARLAFDCSPKSMFLGLAVNGRRVSFGENVFYEFRASRIVSVWSIVDKAAIEAQLEQRSDLRP